MESTDIIIIGCGPTGALLSAYLGKYGVQNIVLEKELEITTDPRGIALDEDGIRAIQGLGLYERLWTEIGQKMGAFSFVPPGKGGRSDMHAQPFLRSNGNVIGPTCHPAMIAHKQPALEKCIRDVMLTHQSCELRSGCEAVSISEDEEFVHVTYEDQNREEKKLRGKFLVGADGKTGFTRKRYLEPRGIILEKQSKCSYEETWVAINLHISLPTPESHPDFPLFTELGYSPEQVYDVFFPNQFRFFCNPERPAVCGRFGLRKDRLWRFEFVVQEVEDGWKMADYENMMKVVGPYLKHAGERYGLQQDVDFPKDCIEVLRSRPFSFSARSCNKWALGRVILCGDSAHVFPPFGGQGIASGFRDAQSLAWRLSILARPFPPPHQPLLEAWYHERKQQLDRSLAMTVNNGSICTERSPVKIFIRDWLIWLLALFPYTRKFLEPRRTLTRYAWREGMPFLSDFGGGGGGKCFPQVFSTRFSGVGKGNGDVRLTDDIIFDEEKRGLFQLVVMLDSPEELESTFEELEGKKGKLGGELCLDEATYIITQNDIEGPDMEIHGNSIIRVLFKEELDDDPSGNYPEPQDYDGHMMRRQVKGKYVILRPDRFIFASCMDIGQLVAASMALTDMFGGPGVSSS